MCHAAVVRSALAHARIRASTAAALARPGVLGVLTAVDLGELGGPIPIRLAPLPGFDVPPARSRATACATPASPWRW